MKKDQLTTIIYLIGKPGVGKYTVAKEMTSHGYKICDNHLINNPIFSLLPEENFSPIPKMAWETIDGIRENVFKFLTLQKQGHYILTNALYETPTDHQLFTKIERMALERQSIFIPVILSLLETEHVKRIQNPQRKLMYKSINIDFVYRPELIIEVKHPHLLDLDLTDLSASRASNLIIKHVAKCYSKFS